MKTKHATCAYINMPQSMVNTILGNVCRIGGRTMVIELTDNANNVSQYYLPATSIESFIMEVNGKIYLREGKQEYLAMFHKDNWKPSDLIELTGDNVKHFIFPKMVDVPRGDDNVLTCVMKRFLRTLPPMNISVPMSHRIKTYISDLNNGIITEDKSLQRSYTLMRVLGYDISDILIVKSNEVYKEPEESFGERVGAFIDTGAQVVNTILGKV